MPWANTSPGDAGPYSDEDWAEMYTYLFGADADARGVLFNNSTANLQVTERGAGANMSVDCVAGEALVNGRLYASDATENIAIPTAHATLDRIDYVVLRADATGQVIELYVKEGTAAASPTPPSLDVTGSPYFELPLARVFVGATVTSISNSNITDVRSFANIAQKVYNYVNNNSGVELLPGDVVVWNNTAIDTVTTTTTEDDPDVAGVVADIIPIGGAGRVQILGRTLVWVDTAVAIGDPLVTSTTVKYGTNVGSNSIGRIIQSIAGAGLVQAYIFPRPSTAAATSSTYEQFQQALGNNSLSSTTWANMTTVDVKVDITTAGGDVEVSASIPLIAGSSGSGATTIYFDIEVDGTRISNNQYGMVTVYWDGAYTSVGTAVISQFRVGSLSAGSHTIRVKYRRESGSAMTPQTAALTFATLYAKEVN